MDDFDFSRFSQDVLKSIETAANIAVGFNTNIVMPCHLVGGLASVRGEEVYAFLEEEGYDPEASLNSIAEGMYPSRLTRAECAFIRKWKKCLPELTPALWT